MDTDRFEQLSRFLSSKLPTRREIVTGLFGASSTVAVTMSTDALSSKQRRRRRRRRNRTDPPPPPPPPFVCPAAEVCGAGCCASENCFAESFNPEDSSQVTYNCCPTGQVCKAQAQNYQDQCCYPDETCTPNGIAEVGVCCRPCGGQCLLAQFECVNGEPELQTTARLPRYRR